MGKLYTLTQRLEDSRSKKVVFLSHCILNENTRYLGGACTGGCVREIIEQCLAKEVGMVQMPCPEQHAWGGVMKRLLLVTYGTKGTLMYQLYRILLPLMLIYTKFIYQRLAKQTAKQIRDYIASGYSVIGVVGIDGSPSCGVVKTLEVCKSFDLIANVNVELITVECMNTITRQCLKDGQGLFITTLQKELEKRQIEVPFLGHDLIAELDGKMSNVEIGV